MFWATRVLLTCSRFASFRLGLLCPFSRFGLSFFPWYFLSQSGAKVSRHDGENDGVLLSREGETRTGEGAGLPETRRKGVWGLPRQEGGEFCLQRFEGGEFCLPRQEGGDFCLPRQEGGKTLTTPRQAGEERRYPRDKKGGSVDTPETRTARVLSPKTRRW